MKKLISIFLLLTLTAPFVANYTWLQIKKNHIKKEVKWKLIEGIDKDELVFLKFSKEEINQKLRWKHSKEFEFEGEMYDIVEVEENADSIFYWVWWDNEETKLNQQLNELITNTANQDQHSKENKGQVLRIFMNLYYQDSTLILNGDFKVNPSQNEFFYQNFYQFYFLSKLYSPPDLIV